MSSTIFRTFLQIQNTAGTNAKKEILKKNMSPIWRQIFEDTYGPQKYYIKKFVPNGEYGHLFIDIDYDTFHNTLMKLANREVTGDAAERLLQATVALFEYESQEILYKIIDRNLKIGISLDNFLDVIGEKESKFEVALAMNLDKVKGVNPIDGSYYISRKLDGCRCICFVTKTTSDTYIEFKSRQNKTITTLDNLVEPIKEFAKNFGPGEYVLDGEVCLMDDFGNEDFQGLMKEVTRKDHTIEKPRYNVFDVLTHSEFDGEVESPNFTDRLNMMHDLLTPNKNVVLLEQELVTSQEVLDKWTNNAQELGWEGCMLRKDAPYKRGRSKDLIKIKKFQDAEYEVIGVETGKATYNEGGHKEFDVVSALYIKHKDNTVKVGSGLSKEQRLRWFDHPEEIIGKTITVQYFEETQDSKTSEYSLRFPVLKHIYEDGRNV
jgi:DNA ligase-1